MNKTKFTPGPWKVEMVPIGTKLKQRIQCWIIPANQTIKTIQHGIVVCGFADIPSNLANARLIASAPTQYQELIDAARDILVVVNIIKIDLGLEIIPGLPDGDDYPYEQCNNLLPNLEKRLKSIRALLHEIDGEKGEEG